MLKIIYVIFYSQQFQININQKCIHRTECPHFPTFVTKLKIFRRQTRANLNAPSQSGGIKIIKLKINRKDRNNNCTSNSCICQFNKVIFVFLLQQNTYLLSLYDNKSIKIMRKDKIKVRYYFHIVDAVVCASFLNNAIMSVLSFHDIVFITF